MNFIEHVAKGSYIESPNLLYRERGPGAISRFGKFININNRRTEIRTELLAHGIDEANFKKDLQADVGVRALFVNRLPEMNADLQAIEVVTAMIQRTMHRLGWGPDSVGGFYVGSSLWAYNGTPYSHVFANELGIHNAKLFDVNAACASGGVTFLQALSEKEMQGKRVMVVALDTMLKKVDRFNANKMDRWSGLVFSQGAAVLGIVPNETVRLTQPYIYFEEPDGSDNKEPLLAARTNYEVHPTGNYKITEKTDHGIFVSLPVPWDEREIAMQLRVGGLFGKGVVKLINLIHKSMKQEEWDQISGLVSHFPNKLIMGHAILNMLKTDKESGIALMPAEILNGMSAEQAKTILEERGLTALPLNVHPKENPYGNAPAANTMMALIENWNALRGDVLFLTFGAGATYAAAKLYIGK